MADLFRESTVIDAAVCNLLIEGYESGAPYSTFKDLHGNPLISWSDPHLCRDAATAVLRIVKQCLRLTAAAFQTAMLYPEAALLAMLQDGQGHPEHADNEKLVDDVWVPNHTPQRDYAGILYLSSAFSGGELFFKGHDSLVVRPVEGLYVSFPCNRDFVHEVKPVECGRRYSLALWFTCSRRYADIPLLSAIDRLPDYTSEDVHRTLFREAPEPKTLEELKEGPRRYVKGRHARR